MRHKCRRRKFDGGTDVIIIDNVAMRVNLADRAAIILLKRVKFHN